MTNSVLPKPGHCGSMWIRISRGAAGPSIQNELIEALNKDQATVYKGDYPGDKLGPVGAGGIPAGLFNSVGPITRESLAEAMNQAPNHTLVLFRFSQSLRPFPRTSEVCKGKFRVEYGEAKDPLAPRTLCRRTTFMLTDTDTAATMVTPKQGKRTGVQIEERCPFPTTVAEWQKMPANERRALVEIVMASLVEDDRQALVKSLQEKVAGMTVEQLQELFRKHITA